jgi:hypothetical protein
MHRIDELLPVYVVFRTPLRQDDTLKSYLARLVVNVEAFAFSTSPPSGGETKPGPSKESIYSSTIKDTNKPVLVQHGEADDAFTYVIWKVDIFISRPEGRFHKPAIYFQPTASFKPASTPKKAVPDDEYLPSRVPTSLNLLQAFDNDPALAGVRPRLSAMRISKITPSAPVTRELVRPIRSGQRPVFRVLPALIWRVRYAQVPSSLSDVSLLASLDLEVASYATYDVRVKKVNLTLHGGDTKPFAAPDCTDMTYKPGDQLTYLYKVAPYMGPNGAPALGKKGHILTMHVEAQVLMAPHCQPIISIEWKTPVDFTASIEPTSMVKAAHRISNPLPQAASGTNPDALPTHETGVQQDVDTAKNAVNVTLTISGPPRVKVGSLFTWTVFIVNRSDKVRKLAVMVIPKRKRDHHSHPSTSSITTSAGLKKELLAPAVVDENIVYAKQKSARIETADLICLTTDIRLGQLSPNACYTADLKFLPLCEGVLGVESVRVVDLGTSEMVDVRDLPSVVAIADG